ncbi:hypothetical protein L9F63_022831 [Diploptera punctata]|uniref:Uncharacterized protein n=1 Tax=Diploptera punctata TaxID=6984 RepID=A0AAD8EA69_DIPPU|nr:hypothetical protein L9F63_022831 [Diploptera punctata]
MVIYFYILKLDGSVEGNACGFKNKLKLSQQMLKVDNLHHFSCCKQLYEEEKASFKKYVQFSEDFILEFDEEFILEFDGRFQDFKVLRPQMEIFNNAMKCKIERQPEEL